MTLHEVPFPDLCMSGHFPTLSLSLCPSSLVPVNAPLSFRFAVSLSLSLHALLPLSSCWFSLLCCLFLASAFFLSFFPFFFLTVRSFFLSLVLLLSTCSPVSLRLLLFLSVSLRFSQSLPFSLSGCSEFFQPLSFLVSSPNPFQSVSLCM